MRRAKPTDEQRKLEYLFRRHLKEQHDIDTEDWFEECFIKEHLEGKHTLIPASIFSSPSNSGLSTLESIVKYLRENGRMRNKNVAALLGRTPASVWITYRNASAKNSRTILAVKTGIFIPTNVVSEKGLGVLEGVSLYLNQHYGMTYSAIAKLLDRDPRTIWTACSRAKRKLAK
ncbi:hypothetical protein JW898_05435 [Candidatus Woesearchaeota archaeon]|nr:hypothetical protein [Candidatus Woesearchaeota archaeon]